MILGADGREYRRAIRFVPQMVATQEGSQDVNVSAVGFLMDLGAGEDSKMFETFKVYVTAGQQAVIKHSDGEEVKLAAPEKAITFKIPKSSRFIRLEKIDAPA